MDTNVIKVAFIRNQQPSGREYTYYTPVPVEIGDRVDIDGIDGISQAIVTRVNVPESEILRFGDKAKSILGKTAIPSCKGIVITPDGEVSVREFSEPLYKTVGAVVGGFIEILNPGGLPEPYCTVVNEEARVNDLPFNAVASLWYGTQRHGHPVMGTVVLLKEGYNSDREWDLLTLNDAEVQLLMAVVEKAKASKLPEEPKNPPPPAQVYTFDSDDEMLDFLTALFGSGRETAIR